MQQLPMYNIHLDPRPMWCIQSTAPLRLYVGPAHSAPMFYLGYIVSFPFIWNKTTIGIIILSELIVVILKNVDKYEEERTSN